MTVKEISSGNTYTVTHISLKNVSIKDGATSRVLPWSEVTEVTS